MKQNKTYKVAIRLTNEEYDALKHKAIHHRSVSHYIRSAIEQYDNTGVKERIEMINSLADFYKKFDSILYHTTANLNQSVKRANELAISERLDKSYIEQYIMPDVRRTLELIAYMKNSLIELMSHTV